MRIFAVAVSICVLLGLFPCRIVNASEAVEPGQIVMSPEDYVRRDVSINVVFQKINNRYEPWEEQANLRQDRTIKFNVSPLNEIACYADKVPDIEKVLGSARKGQQFVLSGYLKKCKREVKVKGERDTYKRTAKGGERYVFIVKKVESVAVPAAPAAGQDEGLTRRQRMMRRRGL